MLGNEAYVRLEKGDFMVMTTLKNKGVKLLSSFGDTKSKSGYSLIYKVRACTVNNNPFDPNKCSPWDS